MDETDELETEELVHEDWLEILETVLGELNELMELEETDEELLLDELLLDELDEL